MHPFFLFCFSAFLAYAIGSLVFGIVFAKSIGLPDLRTTGSCSAGATNALRTGGKGFALLVFLCDVLKGSFALYLAKKMGLSTYALGWILSVLALGHVFPLFFQFKGGKGVAPLLGGLLVIAPVLVSFALAMWLVTAVLFRISSLSALITAALLPWWAMWLIPDLFWPMLACAALLFWTHRHNIQRLSHGIEPCFFSLQQKGTHSK